MARSHALVGSEKHVIAPLSSEMTVINMSMISMLDVEPFKQTHPLSTPSTHHSAHEIYVLRLSGARFSFSALSGSLRGSPHVGRHAVISSRPLSVIWVAAAKPSQPVRTSCSTGTRSSVLTASVPALR